MERIEIRQKEKANEESTGMENEENKEGKEKKRAERVQFRRARAPSRNNAL